MERVNIFRINWLIFRQLKPKSLEELVQEFFKVRRAPHIKSGQSRDERTFQISHNPDRRAFVWTHLPMDARYRTPARSIHADTSCQTTEVSIPSVAVDLGHWTRHSLGRLLPVCCMCNWLAVRQNVEQSEFIEKPCPTHRPEPLRNATFSHEPPRWQTTITTGPSTSADTIVWRLRFADVFNCPNCIG